METSIFSKKIEGLLKERGCAACSGQEYKLQHNYDDFSFMVTRGDYDRGYIKLLIIEGFAEQGYMRVDFVQTADDRAKAKASKVFDFFTAKVRYA